MVNNQLHGDADGDEPNKPARSRRLAWIKTAASLLILFATLWFLAVHVESAWSEFRGRDLRIHWGWAAAAAGLYAVGLLVLGTAWHLVLRDRAEGGLTAPRFSYPETARVFLISQLGKYVPGKAMVLVIRYALLAKKGMTAGLATLTSFYETFSTMASGAIAAAAMLVFLSPDSVRNAMDNDPWGWAIVPLALLFALSFTVAILPPVFALVPRFAATLVESARTHAVRQIRWSTCVLGLVSGIAGWLLLGGSFWATVCAVMDSPLGLEVLPTMTATFALSFIAGFVSMIPGQIGVREAVLLVLLAPLVGGDNVVPIAASVLSRLVTVLVEIALAAILYLTFRLPTGKLPSAASNRREIS